MASNFGVFARYRTEILDMVNRGTPPIDIAHILKAKYETLGEIRHISRAIRRGLAREDKNNIKAVNGGQGGESPSKTTNSSAFHSLKTELGLHGNTFNLPQPLDDEIKIHQLPTACNKILVLSDIHVPFHSIDALTVALKYGQEKQANCIYINGDLIDFYGISRFEKEKRLRSLKKEIEDTRELLSIIRSAFPLATLYLKLGNHDARWNSYIRQNAKEFEDVDDFAFESVMRLSENGFHLIGDRDLARAGKCFLLHGHEAMAMTSPVNPARGIFLKGMQSAIIGHHHRTSEHSGKNMSGEFITCWSTGCLSQLRPKYNPLSSYNHGFAFVETESSGDFRVENKRIDNGKLY